MSETGKRTETAGFEAMGLSGEILRALREMGFSAPTAIQTEAIPVMRRGQDMIGRSQTGTGKTMAFAIPAAEMLRSSSNKDGIQVIIMLPTRELAIQCSSEVKKLTRYCEGIRIAEVYGGAPMEKQIMKLKRANIVIGTPGRIMDHMRRRTMKLDSVRLTVLDEADEMLSMGFKEDMETILRDTPNNRQTVLFSATMPPSIMSITSEFQNDPYVIEINSKKPTLDNIRQTYVDVPMGRKLDALKLLLYYYAPSLSIVFCNTKKMSEEVARELAKSGFSAEALHGDLKQSQRNTVMEKFRNGTSPILVATDVAARGIDVNDVEYVFNYDIPQNREYYIHRIGRTGRIGKDGNSVTICSGRRQVLYLTDIAKSVKSKIEEISVPTGEDINNKLAGNDLEEIEKNLETDIRDRYRDMVNELLGRGHSLFDIAAAALQTCFSDKEIKVNEIRAEKKEYGKDQDYSRIIVNIGRENRVAPNHLVASITERSLLHGRDIGKIEIFDDYSIVAVPSVTAEDVVDRMYGAKVCGKPVRVELFRENETKDHRQRRGGKKHIDNTRSKSRAGKHTTGKGKGKAPSYRKASKRHG